MQFDEKIQIIIIGESQVGKTSILYQYTQNKFSTQYLATVGVEYFVKEELINNKHIRVKIWDTAGQEQYKSITKSFYKNSDGIVIVYDVHDKKSFEKVQDWVQSLNEYTDSSKTIPVILVGNKIDLEREVSTEEGQKLAESFNLPFFESSAKENKGITEFMHKIITDVLNVVGQSTTQKGIGLNDVQQTSTGDDGACAC
jgi:small GTP-binding protein